MVKWAWMVAGTCAWAAGGASACGGASVAPAAPTAEESTGPTAAGDSSGEAETTTEPESAPDATGTKDGDETTEPPPPLEVRYFVSSEGLRVTVSGIEFVPQATPVRVGAGWGVKIDVKARARDDRPHVLFKPEQGPMAFFAVVDRGGKHEEQGDERRGRGEEYVTADGIEFSRTWPGDMGMKPLAPGEKLELQVGLWGVGKSMIRHRPLKGFFTLRMVGGGKPEATLSPPGTAE